MYTELTLQFANADDLRTSGRYEEALLIYDRLKRELEEQNAQLRSLTTMRQGQCLVSLGRTAAGMQRLQEAIDSMQQLLSSAKHPTDSDPRLAGVAIYECFIHRDFRRRSAVRLTVYLCECLCDLAEAKGSASRHDDAREDFRRARALAEHIGSRHCLGPTSAREIGYLIGVGDLAEALRVAVSQETLFRNEGNTRELRNAIAHQVQIHLQMLRGERSPAERVRIAEHFLQLSQQIGLPEHAFGVLLLTLEERMVQCHKDGDTNELRRTLLRIVEVAPQTGRPEAAALALRNWGSLFSEIGEEAAALE